MSNNSNPDSSGTGTAYDDISDEAIDDFLTDDSEDGTTEAEEGNGEDAEAKPEEEGEEPETEGEGDDPDGDQDKQETANSDPTIKLDDGKEMKLSELVAGYQRQDDYTRKTQELAGQRKQFEAIAARSAEQSKQREQQLEQVFEDVFALLAAEMPQEPDPALAYSDPQSYMQQRAFYDAKMQQFQKVMGAQKATREKLTASQAEQQREWANAEAEKVADAFPEARDPAKGREFWNSVIKTAFDAGFSQQEIAMMDSRAQIAFAKLAKYEAREAAKTQPGKTPVATVKQAAPPPFQVKRPAPAVRQSRAPSPASKHLRSFRETGSAEAAARAFDAMTID